MTNQTFDQCQLQSLNNLWITAVQVATVWTTPDSSRDIDVEGVSNPTNIDKWINSLDYEASLALCDENRVQTQLLYGEQVQIIEMKGDWAYVVIPTQPSGKDKRGYPGWVPVRQLTNLSKENWSKPETAAVMRDHVWLETEDGEKFMKLSYMTFLPVSEVGKQRIQVITPHGLKFLSKEAVHIFPTEKGLPKGSGDQIVKAGEPYTSLDYFWGGMSSFGYDCSGLAYAVHKANGYQIARDAGDQAAAGEAVDVENLEPGDLLFFAYEEGKGRLHHVGIYYGEGKMLHSPQTGKGIEIKPLPGTIYEKELCAARRYWHNSEVKEG